MQVGDSVTGLHKAVISDADPLKPRIRITEKSMAQALATFGGPPNVGDELTFEPEPKWEQWMASRSRFGRCWICPRDYKVGGQLYRGGWLLMEDADGLTLSHTCP